MLRRRFALVIAAGALVSAACGTTVTTSTSSGGAGGSDEVGGATSAGGATQGGGGTDLQTTSAGGSTVCQGKACGDPCTVCNDVECLQGLCDADGSCAPFDAVSCPSGAGGGLPACPPPDEVNIGVPCSHEGQVCPSESSCSGVLDCADGAWTLFQLC